MPTLRTLKTPKWRQKRPRVNRVSPEFLWKHHRVIRRGSRERHRWERKKMVYDQTNHFRLRYSKKAWNKMLQETN